MRRTDALARDERRKLRLRQFTLPALPRSRGMRPAPCPRTKKKERRDRPFANNHAMFTFYCCACCSPHDLIGEEEEVEKHMLNDVVPAAVFALSQVYIFFVVSIGNAQSGKEWLF